MDCFMNTKRGDKAMGIGKNNIKTSLSVESYGQLQCNIFGGTKQQRATGVRGENSST